jgi:transposase
VDLLHDRCAGLDVSKKDVKACVRSPGARANQRHAEVRTFATTTNALLELRDWLIEQGVTLIAMEATGDYWRPPFYLLEDDLNVNTWSTPRTRRGYRAASPMSAIRCGWHSWPSAGY